MNRVAGDFVVWYAVVIVEDNELASILVGELLSPVDPALVLIHFLASGSTDGTDVLAPCLINAVSTQDCCTFHYVHSYAGV